MSLYKSFSTDKKLEQEGIKIDYGTTRITIARAGGSNKQYELALTRKTKPYRRAMSNGSLPNEVAAKILLETYVDTIILGWEELVEEKWKFGIMDADGKLLPFNEKNVTKALQDLPDLFADLQAQASNMSLFLEEVREEVVKN